MTMSTPLAEFRLANGKRVLLNFETCRAYDLTEEKRSKLVLTSHFPFVKREHYVVTHMKYADSILRNDGTWKFAPKIDTRYAFAMTLAQVCTALGIIYTSLEETELKSTVNFGS